MVDMPIPRQLVMAVTVVCVAVPDEANVKDPAVNVWEVAFLMPLVTRRQESAADTGLNANAIILEVILIKSHTDSTSRLHRVSF